MAHPHHCLQFTQKLQSTYFNVLYAYFIIGHRIRIIYAYFIIGPNVRSHYGEDFHNMSEFLFNRKV